VLVFGSSIFQACVSESIAQQRAQAAEKRFTLSYIIVAYEVAYKDCLGRFTNENNGAITAVSTLLLTFVTAGLVFIGYRQHRTTRAQLRAYVFVGEVKIIDPDGAEPQAAVTLSNFGKTPAYRVTVSTGACGDKFPPRRTVFDPTPVSPYSSRFVFAPGGLGIRNIPLKTLLNSHRMIGLRNGALALYVYGEILYTDAFQKGQSTKFRFMIGGDGGWPSSNLMVVCPEGNEAS
jgi:hypothetical protein